MQRYRMGYFLQRMTLEMQLAGVVAVLALILVMVMEQTTIRLLLLALFAMTIAALRGGLRREVVLDDHGNVHIGRYDEFIQDPILNPYFTKWIGQPYYYVPIKAIQKIERLSPEATVEGPDRTTTALMRAWLLQRHSAVLLTLKEPAKTQLFSKGVAQEVKQLAISVTNADQFIADVEAAMPRR